ncbi:4_t:CDS:2, partial [Acaulospora colombiana]
MSKKWLNPPLSLQLRRETTNHPNEDEGLPQSIQSDTHDTTTLSSIGRRESSTSVAQYAFVAPSGNYLDLPSAVPFQDSFTPALPSAEFPSSARGFVTPPVTSSTADFPGATHSGHTSIVAAYQHSHLSYNNTGNAISDGRDSFGEEQHQRASNPAIHGDRTTSPASSDPMTIPPQTNNTETTSGATALNRADSSVSYNSVWTIRGEDGSIPRLALDITQFPRPPAQAKASDHASTTDTIPSRETSLDDPYDLSSSGRTMAFPGHPLVLKPGVLRSMARSFNAPASPLFEESEPSSSRPLTPIAVGGVSYKYPIAIGDDPPQRLAGSSPLVQEAFNSISLPLSQGQSQARENPEEYHAPVQYLAPPVPASPAAASARDSSQSMVSQLTVASRGSTTSPHLSFVGDRPARASNLPTPNESAPGQWDQVLSSVKAHWTSSDSVVADPNRQISSAGAGNSRSRFVSSVATSAAVAGSISNNDNEEGDNTGETVTVPATLNPGAPSTALSPLSGESNSDVYSAIGRMSFPKPPFGVESNASSSPSSISPLNEAAAPITALSGGTQSPNRTPRSTWVTGLTLRTRSSRGSLKRRATEDSPLTSPKTPIVPPLPAAVVVEPVTNAGSSQGHATEESVAESKAQELTVPRIADSLPVENSGSS